MPLPITFANLPAGNNPAALLDQEFAAVASMGTTDCTATGTNTILLTAMANQPTPTGYAVGQTFSFPAPAINTGPVTLNVNALGPKNVTWAGAALAGGELQPGQVIQVQYDGTQFQILGGVSTLPPTPTRIVNNSGPLLASDRIVQVFNSTGSALTLTPPASPATLQRILVMDTSGTAGPNNILWNGTLSTIVNPPLVDISWASSEVFWTGSVWLRIR